MKQYTQTPNNKKIGLQVNTADEAIAKSFLEDSVNSYTIVVFYYTKNNFIFFFYIVYIVQPQCYYFLIEYYFFVPKSKEKSSDFVPGLLLTSSNYSQHT